MELLPTEDNTLNINLEVKRLLWWNSYFDESTRANTNPFVKWDLRTRIYLLGHVLLWFDSLIVHLCQDNCQQLPTELSTDFQDPWRMYLLGEYIFINKQWSTNAGKWPMKSDSFVTNECWSGIRQGKTLSMKRCHKIWTITCPGFYHPMCLMSHVDMNHYSVM